MTDLTELDGVIRRTMSAFSERLLEIEQKLARRPGLPGFGADGDGGDGGEILAALTTSDQFPRLQRGEIKTASFVVPARALRVKAITSTITDGTIAPADRTPAIVAPASRRLTIRGLIPTVPTNGGSTEFVRELAYTNSAGPQWDATSPSPGREGAPKNASDLSFELVNSPVVTIAHHFTVSRQALDDSAALGAYIQSRGLYGLALEEEDEILNGDGAAGALSGLVANAAAFTGGATNLAPLDVIRRAITQVAVSEHVPSAVVLNPRDVETLETAKDSQERYLAMVINGTVWRLPIVETNSMTSGKFLVGDFAMAATIRDRQDATVEISLDHLDYRTRNLALVLIEERLGLEIHRPAALVYGDLSYAG
jgi:HK97 family phage major capsid protein